MESPFTHLLETNYVPSKDEIEKINDLLIDPVNQLNHLDTEIARLQSLIETLTIQQNRLHDAIVGHRKLMAPMRRIPRELLQEIFIRCLPTHHNAVMSSREAPLLLGQVCSLWRDVAISTPELWSTVHIAAQEDPLWGWGYSKSLEDDGNIYIEAVETWLGRSGTLPLSISLFCPRIYDAAHEKLLLSTLISFSSRWCNVTILASSVTFSIIASLSQEAVPLLNVFSFECVRDDWGQFTPCDVYRAPHLRDVSSSHSAMIPLDINWSQLTALSIGNRRTQRLTPPMVLDILRKCINLTSCRMEFGPHPDSPLDDYPDTVILPTLETLVVIEAIHMRPFFERLELPALINLEFSAAPVPPRFEVENRNHLSISTLISRVGKLESLTISSHNLTRDALLECIKEAPSSVRQFSVLHYPGWFSRENIQHAFDNEVLGLLTPTEAVRPIFPCLKVVKCNPCGASDEALLTFIHARTTYASAHGVGRLECVDINFDREKEIDITSTFGISDMNITLTYEPHIRRRLHVPWAGLKQPGRLEMTTKPLNIK